MKNYMSAKVKMNRVQNYRLFVDLNLALILIETVTIYLLVEDLGLLWLSIMILAYVPILLAVLGPKENEVEAIKTYEFHLIVEFVILFINTFILCIFLGCCGRYFF